MTTRNFDSRVITDRLQACSYARYIHQQQQPQQQQQQTGCSLVPNPQTANSSSSVLPLFQQGTLSVVQKGLLGGTVTVQSGGTC